MEFLMEILFEVYLELMMFMVPEKGETSKKYRAAAICVALAVLLTVFALLVWGGVLIWDQSNPLGWIPVGIAIVISTIQIIAGIVLYHKNSKENRKPG